MFWTYSIKRKPKLHIIAILIIIAIIAFITLLASISPNHDKVPYTTTSIIIGIILAVVGGGALYGLILQILIVIDRTRVLKQRNAKILTTKLEEYINSSFDEEALSSAITLLDKNYGLVIDILFKRDFYPVTIEQRKRLVKAINIIYQKTGNGFLDRLLNTIPKKLQPAF
ncbi:hypothetical protein ACFLZS_00230 [Patescibacteria group bacterium]